MANIVELIIRGNDQSARAIQTSMKNLEGMNSIIGSLRGTLAGLVSVGSLAALGRSAMELGHDLALASEKLGIGAEKLSAMRYAAELSGVTFEALQKGMKFFSKAITEAQNSGTDAAIAFQAMGVSTRDAAGNVKSLDTLLAEVATKFAGMEDGAGKVSLVVALFGRAGMDMIPLLNKSTEGMAALEKEARKIGATMSDETAKKMEEMHDNLKKIGMASKSVAAVIMVDLVKAVDSLADSFSRAGTSAGDLGDNMQFVFGGGKIGKGGVGGAWDEPTKTKAPNVEAIKKAQEAAFKKFMEWGKQYADVMEEYYGTSKETFEQIFNAEKDAFDKRMKLEETYQSDHLNNLMDMYDKERGMAEGSLMAEMGTGMGEEIAAGSKYSSEEAFKAAESYGNAALAIEQINNGLGDQWVKLGEGQAAINIYKTAWLDANLAIWDSISSLYSGMQDWISSSLQGLITGTMTVMDVLKNLGKMMLSIITDYVAKWVVSRLFMAAFGKTMQAAEVAAGIATGEALAAAYAPAAAFVEIATLGGATAPAMAGLASTVGFAQALSIPMLGEGGIVNRPTIAVLGEKGPEKITPLDKDNDGQTIVLQLDGDVLAKWINRNAKRYGTLRLVPV